MTALAQAFHSVDHIVGLDLICRKCCWVRYGSEEREALCHWVYENCRKFRKMQIVRCAKYVGTMIGPDNYIHRWTAPRKKIQRVLQINSPTKSLVERQCEHKIYAIAVLGFIGSACAPDKATNKVLRIMLFNVEQQGRTTPLLSISLALCVVLVLTEWATILSVLRLANESLLVRPHFGKDFRKFKLLEGTWRSNVCHFSYLGDRNSYSFHVMEHHECL